MNYYEFIGECKAFKADGVQFGLISSSGLQHDWRKGTRITGDRVILPNVTQVLVQSKNGKPQKMKL